jgi:hypothetical protein
LDVLSRGNVRWSKRAAVAFTAGAARRQAAVARVRQQLLVDRVGPYEAVSKRLRLVVLGPTRGRVTAQGSGPEWVVKGGYSDGFKPPTLKQITPGYQEDEGPFTYLANPALRLETSDSVEVGAAWDSPAAGVQAMLFDSRVDDLIVPVATGLPGRVRCSASTTSTARGCAASNCRRAGSSPAHGR